MAALLRDRQNTIARWTKLKKNLITKRENYWQTSSQKHRIKTSTEKSAISQKKGSLENLKKILKHNITRGAAASRELGAISSLNQQEEFHGDIY